MTYSMTIVCLANSRKPPSGRCVAGKVLSGPREGQWIRPVSERPTHEVSEEERRYQEGAKAQLLDIVDVPLKRAAPWTHQPENHVLDDTYYWTRQGRATWNQILELVDPYDQDFWRYSESTYHGTNDKVAEDNAIMCGSSLKLIHLPELEIWVGDEDQYQGGTRRRVRGRFRYHNQYYNLTITDPPIEEHYLQTGNGTYEILNSAICISLGEAFHGYAFRLIASIITENIANRQ